MRNSKYFHFILGCLFTAVLAGGAGVAVAAGSNGSGSFNYTAGASGTTRVQKSGEKTLYSEVMLWNNSTTPVYVGSKNDCVYPICTDTSACPRSEITVPAANVYAQSSSGDVALKVIVVR